MFDSSTVGISAEKKQTILFMQSKFAKAVASGTLSCKVETRQQYREIPNNQPTPFEA